MERYGSKCIWVIFLLLLFSLWVVSNCATPWTPACQASLSFTTSWNLSIESVMLSNHLILCRLLLLLLSTFSSIRVFSNQSTICIRLLKYWSFSFSSSPFNEYSGLISFRIDWFGLLAVQGTLKSLLQNHSSKASILRCSVLFLIFISYYWIFPPFSID